jgi:hypothetical protein
LRFGSIPRFSTPYGVRPSGVGLATSPSSTISSRSTSAERGAPEPLPDVLLVKTGPVEPRADRPKRTVRDFRCPDDLGVFFHPWCAPRVELPTALREEIAKLLAEALIADYHKQLDRWARVQPIGSEFEIPRWQVRVGCAAGRRAFTITRIDWEKLRDHDGKLVEIDVERVSVDGVEAAASTIACLAAEYPVYTERIEVWRYNPKDGPTPDNVEDYLVLENLAQRVNVPKFAERASIEDSPKLRKHLREHVFIVKQRPDKGRFEPKARVLQRLVFLRPGAPRSSSGRLDGEARGSEVLTPANGAGRGPVQAGSLPEDEAAVQTLGRLHAQSLNRPSQRAGKVRKVIGDLLLWDPDEARKLVGGAWALTKLAKERFTDGDRALCRWALMSWRGHAARVLHFGSSGPRTIGAAECSSDGPLVPGSVQHVYCSPASPVILDALRDSRYPRSTLGAAVK